MFLHPGFKVFYLSNTSYKVQVISNPIKDRKLRFCGGNCLTQYPVAPKNCNSFYPMTPKRVTSSRELLHLGN